MGKFTGPKETLYIKPGIGMIGNSDTYLKVMGYIGYYGHDSSTVFLSLKHKLDIKHGDQEKFWVDNFEDEREDHFGYQEVRWLINELVDIHNVMIENYESGKGHLTIEENKGDGE